MAFISLMINVAITAGCSALRGLVMTTLTSVTLDRRHRQLFARVPWSARVVSGMFINPDNDWFICKKTVIIKEAEVSKFMI